MGLLILVGLIMIFTIFKNGDDREYIVEKTDLVSKVEFVGTVKADKDLSLGFELPGKVKKVYVSENEFVEKGTKLIELESNDLKAELSKAYASLNSAIASYEQLKASLKFEENKLKELQEGSTKEEINVAQANIEIKRSELEKAKSLLTEAENELDKNIEVELNNLKSVIKRSFNRSISSLYTYTDLQFEVYPFVSIDSSAVDSNKAKFVEIALGRKGASRFQNLVLSGFNGGIKQKVMELEGKNEVDTIALANEVKSAIDMLEIGYESFRIVSDLNNENLASIELEKQNLANLKIDIINAERTLQNIKNSENEKILTRLANVSIAESSLKQSELDLARVKAGPTETEINIQNTSIEQAKALLNSQLAQTNFQRSQISSINAEIEKKTIYAPIDGTITKIDYNEGEIIPSSEQAIELLATDKLTIEIDLPERNLANVTVGKDVEVTFDPFPGQFFKGKVQKIDRISTLVDKVPVFVTEILLDPSEQEILAGMTGDVSIVLSKKENVIAIPEVFLGEDKTVIIDRDGRLVEKEIKTGEKSSDGLIEVVEGLNEGDVIIEQES